MDPSKAFDCLDHDLLFAKLDAYGFSRNALNLICSYLSDRRQRVKVNGIFSTWCYSKNRSTIGISIRATPFQYLYQRYLANDTEVCNYADDTTVICWR